MLFCDDREEVLSLGKNKKGPSEQSERHLQVEVIVVQYFQKFLTLF